MSATLAFVTYAASMGLALILLGVFHARPWYVHSASVLLALGIGLVPPPAGWGGPVYDLSVGALFSFFFIYGAAAPLFRTHYIQKDARAVF
jgi:hypothetical protein